MQCDNPCNHPPGSCPELLPTQIDTFVTQFFGAVGKSSVNGQLVWSLPCGLDTGTGSNPRMPGESLACYFLRLFEAGIPGTKGLPGQDGVPGLPGPDAFTTTEQDFDQPVPSAPYLNIQVRPSTSLVPGLFYQIDGSGFYQLQNVNPDGSTLFTLIQPQAGAPAVIPSGAIVVPSGMPGIRVQGPTGPKGDPGDRGPQKINSAVTAANFNKPSLLNAVNIQAVFNPLSSVFSTVYVKINGDGYKILSSDSTGHIAAQLIYDSGSPVLNPAGSVITMCGPQGIQGPPGVSSTHLFGTQGYSPFVAGAPSPLTTQILSAGYVALGSTPANTPVFTTPNDNGNFNGTFFAVFRGSYAAFLGGGNTLCTVTVKLRDVTAGADVPGTVKELAVNLNGVVSFGAWYTIPVILTNATGAAKTWQLFGKTNLSGGNQGVVFLGITGVNWFKF